MLLDFHPPEPTPTFGLGHYRSIAQMLSSVMHSSEVVSSTYEPIFKIFSPHKSLPPQLPPLNIQHCNAGNVSQIQCLLHQKEGNFFPTLSNKNSQQSVVFLKDKLGGNLKSRSSPRQCRRGWGVERELVQEATGFLNCSSLVQ